MPNDASGQSKAVGGGEGSGVGGQKIDGTSGSGGGGGGGVGAGAGVAGKKKGREVVVTSDQISAFATKKSPVYRVRFTRQNLVVAGGAFLG